MKPRHIPGPNGKTYCGRSVAAVACISIQSDCIDDAECKVCQRSDDRRVREEYRQTDEYKRQVAEERSWR